MTFRKDFFETFSDQIDGVVHLADKSQLKPSGIVSVRLKLLGLVDYILYDVFYLLCKLDNKITQYICLMVSLGLEELMIM